MVGRESTRGSYFLSIRETSDFRDLQLLLLFRPERNLDCNIEDLCLDMGNRDFPVLNRSMSVIRFVFGCPSRRNSNSRVMTIWMLFISTCLMDLACGVSWHTVTATTTAISTIAGRPPPCASFPVRVGFVGWVSTTSASLDGFLAAAQPHDFSLFFGAGGHRPQDLSVHWRTSAPCRPPICRPLASACIVHRWNNFKLSFLDLNQIGFCAPASTGVLRERAAVNVSS